MLAILQFDAASASVLAPPARRRPPAEPRRPARRGASGTTSRPRPPSSPPVPSTRSTAGSSWRSTGSSTRSSGSPAEQRVRYMATSTRRRRSGSASAAGGTRTLAVDPYESRPPIDTAARRRWCAGGSCTTGSCCRSGTTPKGTHRRLRAALRRPQTVDEVFGRHTVSEMLGLRRRLLGAPGRVADAAALLLGEQPFDLAWLTFCAAHVAGHQFWDLSQLDAGELDDGVDPRARHHAGRRLRRGRRRHRPHRRRPARRHRPHGHLPGRHGRQHQPGRPAPRDAAARSSTPTPIAGSARRRAPSGSSAAALPSGLRAKVAGRPAREGGARPHRPPRAAGRGLVAARGRSPTRPRTRATSG